MTRSEDQIAVQVKYKDVEKTFSGRVNDVWISINKFFSEFIPALEVSQKIILSVDLQSLIRACENIIAFSQEGPHLLISTNLLTDNETLALQLLAGYIGHKLGILETEAVSKEELQAKLGKSSKIVSTRLGELIKKEIAMKTNNGQYRISAFGVVQMEKDFLPKIKAKVSS